MKTVYQVWYMKPAWFSLGIMGEKPDLAKLAETHVHLTDVEFELDMDGLDRVYSYMQAESWSPNGEAMPLILEKGLSHTSMSVGDVIAVDGNAYMVASAGFEQL